MIKIHVLAPHEGGRSENSQDFAKGIWRVYFEDPEFQEMKSAYITKMDLKFKHKIDAQNTENARSYLQGWAEKYLEGKKFEDIEHESVI